MNADDTPPPPCALLAHAIGCCCDSCNPGYHPADCPCGCEGYAKADA